MSNADVIEAWHQGREAKGRTMRTDGVSLYSYDLCIAGVFNGERAIKDYTGADSYSQTTSRHVNLAAKLTGVKRIKP